MKRPLISIGIASIRDIDVVTRVINLLFDKADDPKSIEIVFCFNSDSGPVVAYETQQDYIDALLSSQPQWRKDRIKILFDTTKYGYCSIGDFHHKIVKECSGEFVFFLNDDCVDITEGYDGEIKPYVGKCVILNVDNVANPHDFCVMSRKFIEFNNGVVQYSTYYNYDVSDWSVNCPEISNKIDVEIQHQPTAQFGMRVSQRHDCRVLNEDDYTWNCRHFGIDGNQKKLRSDENGLNKIIKLNYVDIPNLKKRLKENPEYIYDIENNNPDTWEDGEKQIPEYWKCDCCSFELQDIQEQVKDYLI